MLIRHVRKAGGGISGATDGIMDRGHHATAESKIALIRRFAYQCYDTTPNSSV